MNKCAFCASLWLILLLLFVAPVEAKQWRAVHLLDYNTDSELDALGQNLEALAKQGINVIILEVDYNFPSNRIRNSDAARIRSHAREHDDLRRCAGSSTFV